MRKFAMLLLLAPFLCTLSLTVGCSSKEPTVVEPAEDAVTEEQIQSEEEGLESSEE